MLFRQLYDRETCTFTYLLADETTKEAILIDPVREMYERDEHFLAELGLQLKYTLETHVHADHVTSSGLFRAKHGSRSVVSKAGNAPCADIEVEDGDRIRFGDYELEVRSTPGHTDGCVTYVLSDLSMCFTGDTMMIRGCGRTDFQQGSPERLYESVHNKIFSLPDDCYIYPGHDYKGRTRSTVREEKLFNPRLKVSNNVQQFVEIMNNLKLANPKKIDVAVPANQKCGWMPADGEWVPPEDRDDSWAPIVMSGTNVPEVNTAFVGDLPDGVRVVDVRRADEYTGPLGHIEGSEHFLLDHLDRHAGPWDRETPIVTVCKSGGRSGRAAKLLLHMGFKRVASMRGGMLQWSEEGRPSSQLG